MTVTFSTVVASIFGGLIGGIVSLGLITLFSNFRPRKQGDLLRGLLPPERPLFCYRAKGKKAVKEMFGSPLAAKTYMLKPNKGLYPGMPGSITKHFDDGKSSGYRMSLGNSHSGTIEDSKEYEKEDLRLNCKFRNLAYRVSSNCKDFDSFWELVEEIDIRKDLRNLLDKLDIRDFKKEEGMTPEVLKEVLDKAPEEEQ